MGRCQPFGDFPGDPQRLANGQRPLPAQPLLQRLALEEAHDEVGDAALFAHLEDVDDVITVDGGGGLGLAQERSRLPGLAATLGSMALIATSRLSRGSTPRNTMPMPPEPRIFRIR